MNEARQAQAQQRQESERAAKAHAFRVLNEGTHNPEWKDEAKLTAGLDKVSTYLAEKYRMDEQSIRSITDPNAIIIADKARQWDELQAKAPKAKLAVQGKPAVSKPGAKSTASPQSEAIRSAHERFKKNPSIDNAFLYEKAKRGS